MLIWLSISKTWIEVKRKDKQPSVYHSYDKDTITIFNFKDITTLHLGWRFHIKDLLYYVQGHMSITHITLRICSILSQESIFTFYGYQLLYTSLATQDTPILHFIKHNITSNKYIGAPKSTIGHPIHYYGINKIYHHKYHIIQ